MNLSESSHRILEALEEVEGVSKREFNIDGKKILVFDVGVDVKIDEKGLVELGVLTAKAATGGLADIRVIDNEIQVSIASKVALATLGCQMAGWGVKINGEYALASGPARILARKPKNIFSRIDYNEKAEKTALLLESDTVPAASVCKYILDKSNAKEIIIAVFSDHSYTGFFNVLARVVELAAYRLDFLGYDVNRIVSGKGSVEIPSEVNMCMANDALIYNSIVELDVDGWDESLTEKCVSKGSYVYGRNFREIYEKANYNFYEIDESIFAPAKIKIMDVKRAKLYEAGT